MKTLKNNLFTAANMISKNARIILFVFTLVMFVLAAGAPEYSGTIGR
jgi:hypothetical protein